MEVAVALSVGEDAAPDVASPDPVVFVTLSSAGVEIGTGTMGTMVLSVAVSVELFEETDDGLSVGKSVVCSAAVAVDDTSLAVAEAELPVPTELSVPLVVTGTGIAVVPSVPVDVLRLYIGDELSESSEETGTGMTVVPDDPVMVADVVNGPVVVLAGTAMTDVPSIPVTVLEVSDTGAVPVDGAIPVEAVSIAVTSVLLVSDSTDGAGVLMTASVAAAEDELSVVKWLDRPELREEAALDKMLENPEARDCVTAASVAVAATLDKSEPSEEAKLDRAADAASVIGPVVVAVGLPLASENTDD